MQHEGPVAERKGPVVSFLRFWVLCSGFRVSHLALGVLNCGLDDISRVHGNPAEHPAERPREE